MDTQEWLQTTTAGDVMVREVRTLDPNDDLSQAAAVFLREQISGAPVVEASGTCVGVLSASDLMGAEEKAAQEQEKIAANILFNSTLALPMSVYEEKLAEVRDKIAPTSEQAVSRFMTSDVVSVRGDAALEVVVRYMVDAHIHRIVVLDDDRRLLGMISTTDVLAALLRSAR